MDNFDELWEQQLRDPANASFLSLGVEAEAEAEPKAEPDLSSPPSTELAPRSQTPPVRALAALPLPESPVGAARPSPESAMVDCSPPQEPQPQSEPDGEEEPKADESGDETPSSSASPGRRGERQAKIQDPPPSPPAAGIRARGQGKERIDSGSGCSRGWRSATNCSIAFSCRLVLFGQRFELAIVPYSSIFGLMLSSIR